MKFLKIYREYLNDYSYYDPDQQVDKIVELIGFLQSLPKNLHKKVIHELNQWCVDEFVCLECLIKTIKMCKNL